MKPTDLDVIRLRVECALSRFPIHRLSKTGTVDIVIQGQNAAGDPVRWRVSHNSEYGQPGPLAFKLDTTIINRRVEEAGRPVPALVRLGSLNEICRELGQAVSGKNTNHIKQALYQNASAFITAKVSYRGVDGVTRTIEIGGSRYSVIFTGETLPDGVTRADCVYIALNDFYLTILQTAKTRPLDYGYLRDLSPSPQRLYELLSFQMYACLKNGSNVARLAYSEFCMYAPQTRYHYKKNARKQMDNLHVPHRKSGYIGSVEFEAETDREGRPDWVMRYEPGPKAIAEFHAFNRRGGPVVIEIEPTVIEIGPEPMVPEPMEPAAVVAVEALAVRGVTRAAAVALVAAHGVEAVRAQIEAFDWRREKTPGKILEPGAYLVQAIRQAFAMPKGFMSRADRERAATAAVELAAAERASRDQAERVRARKAEWSAYWDSLSPEARARFDAAALRSADRTSFDAAPNDAFRRLAMAKIRADHFDAGGRADAPAEVDPIPARKPRHGSAAGAGRVRGR